MLFRSNLNNGLIYQLVKKNLYLWFSNRLKMPDFLHPDKENYSSEELSQEEKIRPQSFKDFAGQRKTLDNLEVFVAAAKNRGTALDHTLRIDVSEFVPDESAKLISLCFSERADTIDDKLFDLIRYAQ